MENASITRRTRAKFGQLLKFALDDEQIGSSLLKKSKSSGLLPDVNDEDFGNERDNVPPTNERRKRRKLKRGEKHDDKEKSEDVVIMTKPLESKQESNEQVTSNQDLLHNEELIKESQECLNKENDEIKTLGDAKRFITKKIKNIRGSKNQNLSENMELKSQVHNIVSENNEVDVINKKKNLHGKRARRRKKDDNLGTEILERQIVETPLTEGPNTENQIDNKREESDQEIIENLFKIFSIKVHRVDRLKMNKLIKHPLVRVHIVDSITGTYVKKSIKGQRITSKNDSVDFILPSITHPFDIQHKKFFIPTWEEELLFYEQFEHITASVDNVIFFEILDFLPMSTVRSQYHKTEQESGWYHIAWAFLKITGTTGSLNVNRRLQLQLFYPPKRRIRPEPRVIPVFHWWKTLARNPYPGTLFVTLSAALLPKEYFEKSSSNDLQDEQQSKHADQLDVLSDPNPHIEDQIPSTSKPAPVWSRLPGQSCKVPNMVLRKLPTIGKGCYTAAFSRDGMLIACGCSHKNNNSSIVIYEIATGNLLQKCSGHSGLIYDISFSLNDHYIISASADGSARVWKLNHNSITLKHILPHLSYVYCAQFNPCVVNIVATGCFDQIIRIWTLNTADGTDGQLIQELENHTGHVNTICFDSNGKRLFSGDSCGAICIWLVGDIESINGNWELLQEIKKTELLGVSINQLLLHPTSNQIIIHSRDSTIRMLDLSSLSWVLQIKGFLNLCEKIRCCVTPCGNYLFTSSEDYHVYIFNMNTGDQIGIYSELSNQHIIHSIIYHPFEHILAICGYGHNIPIILYKYDLKGVNYVKPSINHLPHSVFDSANCKQMRSSTPINLYSSEKQAHAMNLTAVDSSRCLEDIIQKLDSVLNVSSMMEKSKNSLMDSKFYNDVSNFYGAVLYQVVAERSYVPQRCDELQFLSGDVIDILVIENENWWIGRLPNGRQGYVPVTYVSKLDLELNQSLENDIVRS